MAHLGPSPPSQTYQWTLKLTNNYGALSTCQAMRQILYIQYLIWFSQLLLNIYPIVVPHFAEKQTEAKQGEVTSPQSQTWLTGWARIPAQVWAAPRSLPCIFWEAFWSTSSALVTDLQLCDNLPFYNSLLKLFLCSPLRSFSIWISNPSPIRHTQSVSYWKASQLSHFISFAVFLPGHHRQSTPAACTLTQSPGPAREGQRERASSSGMHLH